MSRLKAITVYACDQPIVTDRRVLEIKVLLRPDEAADILRVSRSQIYDMIAAGELECRTIGGAKRVTSASITAQLDATPRE